MSGVTHTWRVAEWLRKRARDQMTRRYGGTQICPWCRQCAQFGDAWRFDPWDRDPMLDVLTCGVCAGTSLWIFTIGMMYVGPLDPPTPSRKSSVSYDIGRAAEAFDAARPLPSREAVARVLKDELRLIWFYADEPDAAIDEQSIEEATTAILDLFKETSNAGEA